MSAVAPGKALLSVQNIVRSYGAQPVLEDISLTIHEGDRIGLIGRNGSGKSTLMRILAGLDTPDSGLVTRSQGLRVALLAQQCTLPRSQTVAEVVRDAAADRHALLRQYHERMEVLGALPHDAPEHDRLQAECDVLHHAVDAADAWDLSQERKRIAVALDLPEEDRVLASLSGGELRRVDLAARLLEHPDMLLLDEPTNHIDTRSVEWIEAYLESYGGSCVLVTHDRYFLDRVVNRIVELEFKAIYSFPGSYERFLEYKAVVEESQIRAEDNRAAFIRRELVWFRRGAKARSTKQKARIDRLKDAEEQGPAGRHREFLFEIPEPERLGKTILEARALSFRYDDNLLFENFSMVMQQRQRIGILGPNGSGKTTLLRVLMGEVEPARGRVIVGDTVSFIYVDQSHGEIQPQQNILDFVSDGAKYVEVNKRRIYVPSYLEKFLFDRNSVLMPVGNLSGGERNRLYLARKLLRGGNFLVLDEPTNDLDLYTLRVLEETIAAFSGCALIVSHDRFFLNRVCTHMLIFEEGGKLVLITGNYDDYLLYKERRDREQRDDAARGQAARKLLAKPEKSGARAGLSYKEKAELARMEERILAQETELARLEDLLNAPDFYQQDHAAVQAVLDAHAAAQAEVERLFARWEDLEASR